MFRIADRIARAACVITLAGCAGLAFPQSPAQPAATATPAPAKPANFSGCVQKVPGSATDIVISTPTSCVRLTGDAASADKLVGHQVDLTGIFTPRTTSTPASIQINSVNKVGDACSDVCALRPPGSRGLHSPSNQAIPGSEGGTPGVTVQPKQQ